MILAELSVREQLSSDWKSSQKSKDVEETMKEGTEDHFVEYRDSLYLGLPRVKLFHKANEDPGGTCAKPWVSEVEEQA